MCSKLYSCCRFTPALGRWVKWQKYNRTLRDRGESSVLDKRRIKLLNAIDFDWGYQRVPPKAASLDAKGDIKPKSSNPSVTEKKHVSSVINKSFQPSAHVAPISHQHTIKVVQETSDSFAGHMDVSPQDNITISIEEQGSNVDRVRCNQVSPTYNYDMTVRDEISPTTVMTDDIPSFSTGLRNYDERDDCIQHRSNLNRDHSQYNNHEYYTDGYEERMTRQEDFQASENSCSNYGTNAWTCSVCRFATFRTYNEALIHENSCLGLFDNFNFCQSCTYY